eukprot:gene926-1794_t
MDEISDNQVSQETYEHHFTRRPNDIDPDIQSYSIPDVIYALQNAQRELDEDRVASSLSMVSNLARKNIEIRSALLDSGASKLIASILHFNVGSNIVSESALQALCLLVKDGQANAASIMENIDSFSTADGCRDIISILQKHNADPKITIGVFISLCCLCFNDSKRSRFGAVSACEACLDALRVHINSIEVCTLGFKAVVALATENENNKLKFRNCRISELVVNVGNRYLKEVALAEQVLWVILQLSTNDYVLKTQLGDAGACEVVVGIMQSHSEQGYILDIGCQSIASLSMGHERNKARFRINGACEQIVSVLNRFGNISTVTNHATMSVTSLCAKNASLKSKMGGLGVCDQLMDTIKKFGKDVTVAANCCQAIAVLSGVESNKAKFKHVFEYFIEMLICFPKDVVITESIFLAISTLHTIVHKTSEISEISNQIEQAMIYHIDNASVIEQACRAIVNLAADPSHACILGEKGICETIVVIINKHKDVPIISMQALKAVLNLCIASEENCLKFSNAGLSEALVACLNIHCGNFALSELGCKIVTFLLLNHESIFVSHLSEAGACEVVVDILRKHMTSSDISELTCRIIESLARNEMNGSKLLDAGVYEGLVEVLQRHYNVIPVLEYGSWAIATLACSSDKTRQSLGLSGACELLVDILGTAQEHDGVAEQCCGAIRNLCDIESNLNSFNITKCFENISQVINLHINNDSVIMQAAAAVGALTFNNEVAIQAFGALGVCEYLVDILHAHPLNMVLVDHVCLAIVNLSTDIDNATKLMNVNVCGEVIEATQGRIDSAPVVEQVLKIFLNLSLMSEAFIPVLGDSGVCEYVLLAIQRHQGEGLVANICLRVVIALSVEHEANAARFIVGGLCDRVVSCMKRYVERNTLSDLVCRVIVALTTNETRRTMFGVAGAGEAIVDIVRRHMNHPKIILQCCKVIYCLAMDHETNVMKMEVANIANICYRILVKYTDNAVIAEECFKSMEMVCKNRKISSAIGILGGCELVIVTLDKHSKIPSISEQGLKTIVRMSQGCDANVNKFSNAGIEAAVVALVSLHNGSVALAIAACNVAMTMCNRSPAAVTRFVNAGGCEQFCDILRVHFENSEVVAILFDVLSVMTGETAADRLFAKGVCDGLHEAFRRNVNDLNIADGGLRFMISLCRDSTSSCVRLVELGVCASITEVLRLHVTYNQICSDGCKLLSMICNLIVVMADKVKLAARDAFRQANFAEIILMTVSQMTDNAYATSLSFRAIGALCRDNESNTTVFGESGLCDMVCNSLKKFVDSVEVCESSCQVMSCLLRDRINIAKLTALQVSETVTSMIRTHIHSPKVTETGCSILALIPALEDPFLNTNGAPQVRDVAVAVLDRHVDCVPTVVQALRALHNLLTVDGNRTAFATAIESDSILLCNQLMNVLGRNRSSAAVTQEVMLMVLALSVTKGVMKKFSQLGVCEFLVESINEHIQSGNTISVCLEAIQRLCSLKSALSKFLSFGLCECIVESLKANMNAEKLMEQGLDTISLLSVSNDGSSYATKFGSIGGCELVTSAIRQYIKKDGVASSGCKAIFSLCQSIDGNRIKVGNAGGCEEVVSAMKRHAKIAIVAENGCKAIAALSLLDANKVKLGNPACLQVIEALTRHSDNAAVAENSLWAAIRLSTRNEENKASLHIAGVFQGMVKVMRKHHNITAVTDKGKEALKIFVEG